MSDLEQRLADELDAVAGDLRAPDVDHAGLARAGRRERVRRAVGPMVLVTATALALAGFVLERPGRDASSDPAGTVPTVVRDGALGRPLELPWWTTVDDQDDPDAGVLHVDGEQIAVTVTALRHGPAGTLVEHDLDGDTWSYVDGARLVPFAAGPLDAAPVLDTEGGRAWVSDLGADGWSLTLEVGGRSFGTALEHDEPPVVVGLTRSGRALTSTTAGIEIRDPRRAGARAVTGLPAGVGRVASPVPGRLALQVGDRVVVGDVDAGARFRELWTTEGDGTGAWSDDGEQYADLTEGGVRFATRAGRTVAPLASVTDLRVVGWESSTEVVVAQWIPQDEAVVGLWRCSAVELQCAEVADAPTGRVLLPGLLG